MWWQLWQLLWLMLWSQLGLSWVVFVVSLLWLLE
jgi:hypothetical protein